MKNFKQIVTLDTFWVRHSVFLTKKSAESSLFKQDSLDTAVHFGLHDSDNLLEVVSLFDAKSDSFIPGKQFRIRGTTVLKQHQKKGLEKKPIIHAEKKCCKQKPILIWINIRKDFVGFYIEMGYQIKGLPFEIKGDGEYIVMFKDISDE